MDEVTEANKKLTALDNSLQAKCVEEARFTEPKEGAI